MTTPKIFYSRFIFLKVFLSTFATYAILSFLMCQELFLKIIKIFYLRKLSQVAQENKKVKETIKDKIKDKM
jgi:hypothetical protein